MAAPTAISSALDPANATKDTMTIENTSKRDELVETEKFYQKKWSEDNYFWGVAPTRKETEGLTMAEIHEKYPKYFANMAYPYMNGTLHVGHSFSVSKVEFATGWARMEGKRTLYPQGYHCTGMPIKACADKLIREIEMFGEKFERCPPEYLTGKQEPSEPPAPTEDTPKADVTKFKATKGKTAAKTVQMKFQFQIMLSIGIALEDIHKFADAHYWLEFFPPLCKRDLSALGCRIDWRRQMVTTDANPYYDSFVRWQVIRLKELDKIKFGKRYTVYCPKDGQACMDHDRSEGEGIGVQEYTALKLKVKKWAEEAESKVSALPKDANVYFVPATLRPETMYGQNCCFVGPTIQYGIYKVAENEYYFISDRAARNMAFQNLTQKWGEYPKVADLLGSDVIGTFVDAPLSVKTGGIYILPMETVKATKGTGVVTCVPSDSPDDYATIMDLSKKAEFLGLNPEWIDTEIVPVIETPAYGNLTAKTLVEQLKIQSPKDTKQLAEAKDLAYKEGFYKGTMIIGDFKGEPVFTAKEKVRKQLIDAGEAFNYAEPDGFVLSRSGDECVAGHLDQWYMNYGIAEKGGDAAWQKTVMDHVLTPVEEGGLNTFSTEIRNSFEATLNWLAQWACARSYGLGTRLPWSPSELIESLSDSTIYASYYTIAHHLHEDYFGKIKGPHGIKPEQMTLEVWDYLFTRTDKVPDTIPKDVLDEMKHEFLYWYPLDLNTSGKDLVGNHLSFFLYIHVALFPKNLWPAAIRMNGHLQLNGSKMSKSTGNFLTLHDCVNKFGADATRIALADAGDGLDDANFAEAVANSTILRMYELRNWCESMVKEARLVETGEDYRAIRDNEKPRYIDPVQRTGPREFWDDIFQDELNGLVKATRRASEKFEWKIALKNGLYDFTSARDAYREATKAAGVGMHQDLVLLYIKYQALMVTVVAPHWAEYIWLDVLKQPKSVQYALFPEVPEQIPALTAARDYVRTTTSNITSAEGAQQKRQAKGKVLSYDPKQPKVLSIYVAKEFPSWQEDCIELIRKKFDGVTLDVKAVAQDLEKSITKKAMPYVQNLKKRLESGENPQLVYDRRLPFDESDTLRVMIPGLLQTIQKCSRVEVVLVSDGGKKGTVIHAGGEDASSGVERTGDSLPPQAEAAEPGRPQFHFANL